MCSALGLACITVDKTHPQKTSPTLNLYSRDGDKQTGKKTNLYLGEFCDVCNGEGVGKCALHMQMPYMCVYILGTTVVVHWDREQEVLRWEPRAIIWIWGHGGLLSPCLFPQGVAGIEEGPLFADIGRRHLGGKGESAWPWLSPAQCLP